MLHNKANTSPKSYAQGLFCISEEERMERGKKNAHGKGQKLISAIILATGRNLHYSDCVFIPSRGKIYLGAKHFQHAISSTFLHS